MLPEGVELQEGLATAKQVVDEITEGAAEECISNIKEQVAGTSTAFRLAQFSVASLSSPSTRSAFHRVALLSAASLSSPSIR